MLDQNLREKEQSAFGEATHQFSFLALPQHKSTQTDQGWRYKLFHRMHIFKEASTNITK